METRLPRLFLWGVAAFAAATFLAVAWLYFLFPGRWLAARIARDFERTTHWRLVLPSLSPFPLGRFETGEIRLEDPEGRLFFRIDGATLRYRIVPALSGTFVVEEITLRRPEILLRREGGRWNFERLSNALFPVPSPPGPLSKIDYLGTPFSEIWPLVERELPRIRLDRLAVERLLLTVDDGEGNLLVLPPLDLRARLLLTEQETKADVGLAVSDSSPLRLNGSDLPFSLRASLGADPAAGEVEALLEELSLPGHLAARGRLLLEAFGTKSFALSGALRTRSGKFPIPLPEIDASADLKGRLDGSSFAELREKLLRRTVPLRLDLSASLAARRLAPPFVPAGHSLADLNGALAVKAGEADTLFRSSLSARRLSLPGLPTFDLTHEGEISLTGLRSISIPRFRLELPSFGAAATLEGTLSSALPFPDVGDLKGLRENVTADLSASFDLDASKAPPTIAGLALQGKLGGSFELKKSDRDRLDVALLGTGSRFSASLPDGTRIENLSFRFPLRKTLSLGPAAAVKGRIPDASLWARDDSSHLYTLSPYANSLSADRVVAGGFEAKNLSLDAGFDGSNLIVDRFAADLLGGSLWGRMTLLPAGEALQLTLAAESVGLDLAKLTGEPFAGDARISFDARSALSLLPGRSLSPEGLLDDLSASFHLTKVGDQTLDRLITFLDPKGEDPSLVQARSLLAHRTVASALREPRVSLDVARGRMDADIVLPGVKMVDLSIPIRGISVKNLLRFQGFRKSIAGLAPLLEATRYLRLTGIDDAGNPVFSKGTP